VRTEAIVSFTFAHRMIDRSFVRLVFKFYWRLILSCTAAIVLLLASMSVHMSHTWPCHSRVVT